MKGITKRRIIAYGGIFPILFVLGHVGDYVRTELNEFYILWLIVIFVFASLYGWFILGAWTDRGRQ